MALIIAYIYIGFVLGLLAHYWMVQRGIEQDFWDGFTFLFIREWFAKKFRSDK